ncbi:MAG: alpha/beta hydrolase family protein [Candidatus Hodarchaeales archaeon]
MTVGTYSTDENVPIRISFDTYSKYTNELNSFFNRTEVSPLEDAQNKLIEDYRVAGYLILPKKEKPVGGYPVIIWMHGFGVSSEWQMNYPRQFAKEGFLTIAIDQPGHGWSGGYWDMGVQTLLGVYSTIEWLVNESDYKNIIDNDRIGVSGHSMGGIATTRAGIFDSWINPKTGRKIGTGIIKSSCAVFSWDNLETMAEELMLNNFGIENAWSQPTIIDLLGDWRWLSNHDPNTLEEELNIRSVTNFINNSNIKNYCLIIGGTDELVSVASQSNIMANATKDSMGIPNVSWDIINDTIYLSTNHTWNYGNKSDGSGRRLVLIPGRGHLGEAISGEVVNNMTSWFYESLDYNEIIPIVPEGFQLFFFIKMAGWLLVLVGSLAAIFPTFSYLSKTKIGLTSALPEVAPFLDEKKKKIGIVLYVVTSTLLISVTGIFRSKSITHFWIFDLMIPVFLLSAIILFFPTIMLVFFEKKRFCYEYRDLGLNSSLKDNLKAVVISVLAIVPWIMLFNVLGWFFQVPIILPRPLEIGIYLDLITILLILLLFNFNTELLFRSLYQTKNQKEKGNERSSLVIIGKSGLMSGSCIGFGFGTVVSMKFLGLLLSTSLLFILVLYSILIAIFTFLGIISAKIYQETGSVVSSTVFTTLLMTLIISGKLFLAYA